MSIMQYNGACIVAMTGRECVAIASDNRFGIRNMTLSTDFKKVFEFGPHLYLGLGGLATDVQTVSERLHFRVKLFELRENKAISPHALKNVVANFLYEHRFGPYFVEPIIAGLHKDKKGIFQPYIASADLIGCSNEKNDFVVVGTSAEMLYGMCETLWVPDLSPDDLFETISQSLTNAMDRDALAGWGVTVQVIEKDKITTRVVKTRMD